jgi:hypothetical protein
MEQLRRLTYTQARSLPQGGRSLAGLDTLMIVLLLLLGGTVHGLAQGERCGRSGLDPLGNSGFEFIATCEQQNDEMLVSVTARRRSAAEMPGRIVPKELRRLKLSFSGVLAGADGPPGYQVVTDITEQPKRVSVTWTRTDAVVDNVDLSGFTVRLRGQAPAITCPHEFAADTIIGGLACGIRTSGVTF